MLTQLSIQGLAIIETLDIEFSEGFNVITGETGAGKSILIKALGLLLGGKASPETVRQGRPQATVTGTFYAPLQHPSAEVLDRYGIPREEEEDGFPILVRRTITNKGRSQAWINDVPITIGALKELADTLIDVFAQHENQRLLDPWQHILYVDQFLKNKEPRDRVRSLYHDLQGMFRVLTGMADDFRAKQRDADYLAFRCQELEAFDPSVDDHARVQDLCRKAGSAFKVQRALETARALIDSGADGEPLAKALRDVARTLKEAEAVAPEFKPLAEEARDVASRLDDLSFELGRAGATFEFDEADLETAQKRLAGYQDLIRKLGVADVDGLILEHERLRSELEFLESAAAEVKALLNDMLLKAKAYEEAAEALSQERVQASKDVAKKIEGELAELAMPNAQLVVEMQPVTRNLLSVDLAPFGEDVEELWFQVAEILTAASENGRERAHFLLAANKGEPPLPLHKVASGGEVSRIMLAFKRALAAGADTCILVFDEIDTGISGRVADTVGRKMAELAWDFQVICISHLPQVAAYADTHFRVEKLGRGQRTESFITQLNKKQSEEEIARLLSGEEVTKTSLANARALIRKARDRLAR